VIEVPSTELIEAARNLRLALARAGRGLVARDWLLELVCLAAIAGEHVLVVGPAGTAKSEAVRRVARVLGGSYFEYLLGRFTEPSELFGPVDLRKLREGVVETVTEGMLPEAEVAFLDELFLGSSAILNTLLGILNERRFRRGHTIRVCPLKVCVGASNVLPADESLAALADRFLVRAFVHPVADAQLEELLEAGFSGSSLDGASASMHDVEVLARASRQVDLSEARPVLAQALRTLRNAGIALTDRRAVRSQGLVAAAAVLAGRTRATAQDVWPVLYTVPTEADQASARELLHELLARSESPVLPSAAEQASFSRMALATRLVRDVEQLLQAHTEAPAGDAQRMARLRIEALGREIDAGFAGAIMSDELRGARDKLSQALS
jgi:MoxR-like ATPase